MINNVIDAIQLSQTVPNVFKTEVNAFNVKHLLNNQVRTEQSANADLPTIKIKLEPANSVIQSKMTDV